MSHEDSLDSLLATRRSHRSAEPPSELEPLLENADRLASIRETPPSAAFSRRLEARMLAHAAELAQATVVRVEPAHWRRALGARVALIAACVLLALGTGALAVAAGAEPGAPLFRLHRLEQGVQAGLSRNSANQHITFARQWLYALDTAAAQRQGDPAYSDALLALREEDASAAQDINAQAPGVQRSAMEAQLSALRADEVTAFRNALPRITWTDRVTTTQALGALGVAVPHITSVSVSEDKDGQRRAVVRGDGIQPGAVLLVDGQSIGALTANTNGTYVATISADVSETTLAVSNPDGMTTVAPSVSVVSGGIDVTPAPSATAQPEETPLPEETPMVSPTSSPEAG